VVDTKMSIYFISDGRLEFWGQFGGFDLFH